MRRRPLANACCLGKHRTDRCFPATQLELDSADVGCSMDAACTEEEYRNEQRVIYRIRFAPEQYAAIKEVLTPGAQLDVCRSSSLAAAEHR